MVSIRYFSDVGELRRTKSTPFKELTRNTGSDRGFASCANELSAKRSTSKHALALRTSDNPNERKLFSFNEPSLLQAARKVCQFLLRISRAVPCPSSLTSKVSMCFDVSTEALGPFGRAFTLTWPAAESQP